MNIFHEYQYGKAFGYQQFTQFSATHLAALIISIVFIVGLPWWAKHHLSETWQKRIGNTLAVIIFSNLFVWMGIELAAGTFDTKLHLPLHLCRFSNLLVPLVLIFRNRFALDVLYGWCFSGILQATLTPDLQHDFPHFMFFRYWIGHPAMILAIIYAIVVYQLEPSKHCVRNGMIGLNLFFVSVATLNYLLGSNYFFLCAKPATKSVLDFFGDWPWYLVVCEVLFFVHFAVAYWVFNWSKRKNKKNHSTSF